MYDTVEIVIMDDIIPLLDKLSMQIERKGGNTYNFLHPMVA